MRNSFYESKNYKSQTNSICRRNYVTLEMFQKDHLKKLKSKVYIISKIVTKKDMVKIKKFSKALFHNYVTKNRGLIRPKLFNFF